VSRRNQKGNAEAGISRGSVALRLQARLSAELGRDVALPKRTYAGRRQLERFCISWFAREGLGDEVASIFTMTACLKAEKLKIRWNKAASYWEVQPHEGTPGTMATRGRR
jgi:hypothetical protein